MPGFFLFFFTQSDFALCELRCGPSRNSALWFAFIGLFFIPILDISTRQIDMKFAFLKGALSGHYDPDVYNERHSREEDDGGFTE